MDFDTVRPVVYEPALVIGVGKRPPPHSGLMREPLAAYRRGKFVVGCSGDHVTLYGMLCAKPVDPTASGMEPEHGEVLQRLYWAQRDTDLAPRIIGGLSSLILGGGSLDVDHNARVIYVGGESGSYGAVPRGMLEKALDASAVPDYRIVASGPDHPTPGTQDTQELQKWRDWYGCHGLMNR